MSVVRNLHAGVCAALLCALQPANADEIEVVDIEECRIQPTDDPSLLIETILPKGTRCVGVSGGNKVIIDLWLGIEWPTKQSGGMPRVIEEYYDPLASGTHKACTAPRSRGGVIDVWVIPKSEQCELARTKIRLDRRFYGGLVCLRGTGSCIKVADLKPHGSRVAAMLIRQTLETKRPADVVFARR